MAVELGRFGVFGMATKWATGGEAAAELEELGFGALWLGGSPPADLEIASTVLAATGKLTVATGIVNVWTDSAVAASAGYRKVSEAHPNRFLLGLGAGHRETNGTVYQKPYQKLVEYLDELTVPREDVVLAALGPKVLQLAADRTAGAHPYLVTPEHTAQAREILGPDAILAPEQHVILETDPAKARALGRQSLAFYLDLPNYTNNFLRFGFTAEDIADGGSDRLIDALVAWGTVEQVAARLREHHVAGANHVAIQVVTADGSHDRAAFRDLAGVLF
jgi:probable F420-dependent oxidoreductase